jgi:hypothetical protein
VARPFELACSINTVGATSFAVFAKGGYRAASGVGYCRERDAAIEHDEPYRKQHRTRPCKGRKDGAPSVLMAPTKGRATRPFSMFKPRLSLPGK